MTARALNSDNIIMLGEFTVLVKPMVQARRLTLRFDYKKAHFTLSTPKRASRRAVLAFLDTHRDWMAKQQQIAPKKSDPFATGSLLIEGIERRLLHEEGAGVQIDLLFDTLLVRCRRDRLPRAVSRFLKQHAEKTIMPLAREKARVLGVRIAAIGFRDTSSRWGSCSHDGNLSFSWRLIMAPPEVIDYVVAHEVAHLKYFDHGANFWNLCRELSMHFTAGKHWLKLHGAALQAVHL